MDPLIRYDLIDRLNEMIDELSEKAEKEKDRDHFAEAYEAQCKAEELVDLMIMIEKGYIVRQEDTVRQEEEYIEIHAKNYKEYLEEVVEVSDDDFERSDELTLVGYNKCGTHPIICRYGVDGRAVGECKRARVKREK